MDLIADPAAASVVRDRLRSWLRQLEWPANDADDIVLAVSEAVANVIDHAYDGFPPGRVWIVTNAVSTPDSDRQRVQVIVGDRGRWRPIPDDPGYHGHGLPIMNDCMHRVHIRRHTDGTTVIMTSAAVRPEAGPTPPRPSPDTDLMRAARPSASMTGDDRYLTSQKRPRHDRQHHLYGGAGRPPHSGGVLDCYGRPGQRHSRERERRHSPNA